MGGLIIMLMIIGVGLWAINTYVPMAQPIKTILNVVVVLLVVIWVVNIFIGPINLPPPQRLFR